MGTRNRNSLENYPLRFVTTTCHKWLPLFASNGIHENPIRKKYVGAAEKYSYSSASFYLTGEEGPVHVKHYAEVIGIPGYGAIW